MCKVTDGVFDLDYTGGAREMTYQNQLSGLTKQTNNLVPHRIPDIIKHGLIEYSYEQHKKDFPQEVLF